MLVEDRVIIKFKLDSNVNIVSLKIYNTIFKSVEKNIRLYGKSISMDAYGGTNIEVLLNRKLI